MWFYPSSTCLLRVIRWTGHWPAIILPARWDSSAVRTSTKPELGSNRLKHRPLLLGCFRDKRYTWIKSARVLESHSLTEVSVVGYTGSADLCSHFLLGICSASEFHATQTAFYNFSLPRAIAISRDLCQERCVLVICAEPAFGVGELTLKGNDAKCMSHWGTLQPRRCGYFVVPEVTYDRFIPAVNCIAKIYVHPLIALVEKAKILLYVLPLTWTRG